jgi:hypothetical protein
MDSSYRQPRVRIDRHMFKTHSKSEIPSSWRWKYKLLLFPDCINCLFCGHVCREEGPARVGCLTTVRLFCLVCQRFPPVTCVPHEAVVTALGFLQARLEGELSSPC